MTSRLRVSPHLSCNQCETAESSGSDDPFVDLRVEHGDDPPPASSPGMKPSGWRNRRPGVMSALVNEDTQLVEPLTEFVFGDVRETEEVTECADT